MLKTNLDFPATVRGGRNRCLAKTDPLQREEFTFPAAPEARRVLGDPLGGIRVAGWGLRPHHSADHRIKNQIWSSVIAGYWGFCGLSPHDPVFQ